MIDVLVPLVKRFEGIAKVVGDLVYPYLCPAGKPTQGWGVLVKDLQVPPITRAQADAELMRILPGYFELACRESPTLRTAPPEIQAAIADFVYNLGIGRYRASTLRRRVDARDWEAAAGEILKWNRGGGRVLPGLVARCEARAQLIRAGAGL